MLSVKNIIIYGSVIVIFIILQVILILVGKADNPVEAAIDFTKAYYMLDGPSMSKRICSEFAQDQNSNLVNDYLYQVAVQARSMGFSPDYMRSQLSDIHAEIQMADKNNARVRITAERMRSINPLFAFIGRVFFLIEPHKVDVTVTLIKEDDTWKVCSKPLLLSKI
jgi:hypothetical protein